MVFRDSSETTIGSPGEETDDPRMFPVSYWDRYEFIEFLGAGGMGRVYKARDIQLNRYVALKFIRGDDPGLAKRLLVEARAQARIEHEFVCKVYEVGEVQGKRYIAMQYIEGEPLQKVMSALGLQEKVKLMERVADAVHAAHRAGLVHRDLKPANIMVSRGEGGDLRPVVMDFGLVHDYQGPSLTSSGAVLGSPWYMSPEQALGNNNQIDQRTDIFSMGATFYELLSGQLAFTGDSGLQVLMKIVNDDPVRLRQVNASIPSELETIVMKCLEKSPDRRYGSAHELAQDLRRHIDGEPILARPTGVFYRISKKTRKHKAVAALVVVVFAALLLTGQVLRTRLQANKQALMAQQFGQQIERIEASLREAYLLPLHDTAPEKKQVLQTMRTIQEQMEQMDEAVRGPGEYALGRGYMALRNYAKAREHLDRGWNRYGYQPPEAAFALGLTMSMLYRQQLREAARITNKDLREIKLKEIDRLYRKPAFDYIQKGRSASTEPFDYVEALIAFLDKNYDSALQKAESAVQQSPRLYQARKLEGDIYVAQADQEAAAGHTDAATGLYEKAEAAYRDVIRQGESDSIGYEGICGLHAELMTMQLYQTGLSLKPAFEVAVRACDDALKADSENPEVYKQKSKIYARWGDYQRQHSENPLPALQEATTAAEKALKFSPDDADAYYHLGLAKTAQGQYQEKSGLDPRPSFRAAIEADRNAIRIDPNHYRAYNGMGNVWVRVGVYENGVGLDPTNSLTEGINAFRTALPMHPVPAIVYNNLCLPYFYKALYEISRGKDPRQSFQYVDDYGRKAIQRNATYWLFMNNTGIAWNLRAEYEMDHGLDPQPSLKQAFELLQKGLQINPSSDLLLCNLGRYYMLQAEYEASSGLAPETSFEHAIATLQKSIQSNAHLDIAHDILGYTLLSKIRYEMSAGRGGLKTLQAAAQAFEDARRVNPRVDEFGFSSTAGLAETHLLRAEYLLQKRQSALEDLSAADALILQTFQINRHSAAYHVLAGKARMLRGRSEIIGGGREVDSQFQQAGAEFQEALKIKPDYGEAYEGLARSLLLRYEQQPAGTIRDEIAKSAADAIVKALEINPNMPEAKAMRLRLVALQADRRR